MIDHFLHFNNKPSSNYQLKVGTFFPLPPLPPPSPSTDCLRWNKCGFQFWPVRLAGTLLCSMESCAQVSVDYDITNTIRRSLELREKIIRRERTREDWRGEWYFTWSGVCELRGATMTWLPVSQSFCPHKFPNISVGLWSNWSLWTEQNYKIAVSGNTGLARHIDSY